VGRDFCHQYNNGGLPTEGDKAQRFKYLTLASKIGRSKKGAGRSA